MNGLTAEHICESVRPLVRHFIQKDPFSVRLSGRHGSQEFSVWIRPLIRIPGAGLTRDKTASSNESTVVLCAAVILIRPDRGTERDFK